MYTLSRGQVLYFFYILLLFRECKILNVKISRAA